MSIDTGLSAMIAHVRGVRPPQACREDDVSRGVCCAEKPGFRYWRAWRSGGQPCVQGVLISGPGFFLDLGKARLLVNSSPQPGGPAWQGP